MTAPYAPSQLSLSNFDATQAATATWVFSSSDTTVTQKSFDLQIYNNSTGALVLDTGTVTSALAQYTIPASTLVNRTQYKWRVQYTDSAGNVSPWSSYQTFTCSSIPTVSISSPTNGQMITSNEISITDTYAQAQSVGQQSYHVVVYKSDQSTIAYDSGVVYNTANVYSISGIPNGTYYVQATVVSTDGLATSTGKIQFVINYSGSASIPSITTTPLSSQAAVRIDWSNPKSIPGNYVGPTSSPTYKPGKFNDAIQIAAYGEKVWWTLSPFGAFTYTSWWLPNMASSAMTNNQIVAYLQADSQNYIQMRYDHVGQAFILDVCVNGNVLTTKSSTTGLTFNAGAQNFIAIRQNTAIDFFVGIGGTIYKTTVTQTSTSTTNTYGVGQFGTAQFTNNLSGAISNFKSVYIGCNTANGNEANALFDQTHLTSQIMDDATIEALYTNNTNQQFTLQTMFLANFDDSLEGGNAQGITIDHWLVKRSYNGATKQLGTVANSASNTLTYTDYTPLSQTSYQYSVTPVDSSGNTGPSQTVQGTVSFQGWWLSDTSSSLSFQFLAMVDAVPIKKNYGRVEYKTFGTYPVVAYSPASYRSGKLTGWIVNNLNGASTPYQQYQTLQSLIDNHHILLLRGDEGWGMMVDCYDPMDTVPKRGLQQYNTVEITWTEVAAV